MSLGVQTDGVAEGRTAAAARPRLPVRLPRSSPWLPLLACLALLCAPRVAPAQAQAAAGGLRGAVVDHDFDLPLAGVSVLVVETGARATTTTQGSYVFGTLPAGRYTVIFSRDEYIRLVRTDVVVNAGQLTDLDVRLFGEYTDMDEFIVQEISLGAGSEGALLKLRLESPAIMDAISADMMSRAGASDAASALTLVSGASVSDGRFAVIRGLPDRYVSSQLNGIRLPSADENTRAVELDLFPAAVIESMRVSKTFTPDQQGDASGGAVDIRLKGIPDENHFEIKAQYSRNDQAAGRNDFLTYKGGGLDSLGKAGSEKDQQLDLLGESWKGGVGVIHDDAPIDRKWSVSGGGGTSKSERVRIGGFASLFQDHDSSFYDNGKEDSWWVETPGAKMTPETLQGSVLDGDFKTSLFDVTRASQSVQWGGLGTLGIESDEHALGLNFLYTHTAEDVATLAEDKRGKSYFFPGYDPNDPQGPGNNFDQVSTAPWLRTETLEYTERTARTIQLTGRHELPLLERGLSLGEGFTLRRPKLEWSVSDSLASLDQPDKRQFGSLWWPASFSPGFPPFVPPSVSDPTHFPFKPAANFKLGNLQRIWKKIDEDSEQYAVDLTVPFENWSGREGSLKLGLFEDRVKRGYDQDTFSNFDDAGAKFQGDWTDLWSGSFPTEDPDHPITAALTDVDYSGEQQISAWYGMLDLPVTSKLKLVGGTRWESTKLSIVNDPEEEATWFPKGSDSQVKLNPGDGDVDFAQDDVLPSVGLIYDPQPGLTLRGSWSRTIARQTFKELSPILQQEFLGGPIFVGNPDLLMSDVTNYDLRVDHSPTEGALLSASWFRKDITDPIEYVQKIASAFTYTTPVNYPKGQLSGFELEARQHLGRFWESLDGISAGVNATFIDSEVELPADEIADFAAEGIEVPITKRDMTNAPEHLYNLFLTWDLKGSGTKLALFYTVQGDTLVAGAGESVGNFVPSVYAKEHGTLNFSLSQEVGERTVLQFQAKNLTNPRIEEVYAGEGVSGEKTRSSFTRGREFSLGVTVRF